ncbi:MAG: SAM-dependent methyltransferase [Streptomyces sp.]|nr:SAM-dependent methyltransferase [Streptomyces sp.]
MRHQGLAVAELDTRRPHPARMYDFYLGGRDNYEVDREAAQRVIDLFPGIVPTARAGRSFMHRAVRHMVAGGVRQIIDIGTGIPTAPNTHQIAHGISPDVRVAYIDNDPIVASHSGAHLRGAGNTGFFLADLRDPQTVLGHPTIGKLIDFDRPIGLMLLSVLHFLPDDADPHALVAAYRDRLPAGSFLALSHASDGVHPAEAGLGEDGDVHRNRRAGTTVTTRSHEQILRFFDGFDLAAPGLVRPPLWRPDGRPPTADELRHVGGYAGIGSKL